MKKMSPREYHHWYQDDGLAYNLRDFNCNEIADYDLRIAAQEVSIAILKLEIILDLTVDMENE